MSEALQSESRNASGRVTLRRVRQTLVVAQLGLSLTLLIAAGLLAKSFLRLRITDPGFRAGECPDGSHDTHRAGLFDR